jgi:large subunit ribosomal protein L7/L12
MADDDKTVQDQEAPVTSETSLNEAPEAESAQEAAKVLAPEVQKEETAVEEKKAEEPKKTSKPASKNLEEIIEKIEKLSVLELADLVHALEDRFGVTAAAPMAMVGAAPAAAGDTAPGEEQTQFDVILASAGANKIGVIKAVRELVPTLGLKEAKDLVEAAPKPVLEGVNKEAANEAKTKLTAAGATVDLQ